MLGRLIDIGSFKHRRDSGGSGSKGGEGVSVFTAESQISEGERRVKAKGSRAKQGIAFLTFHPFALTLFYSRVCFNL
jgi:hypothetical protein